MPELYFQDYPNDGGATPLVLLHGLFGSSTNWRGIAKTLADDRRVLAMDLRNHGRSFHDDAMSYPAMAQDVLDTLDGAGIERAHVLGHSMGGKTAMVAALSHPGRLHHLVVADIAPVIYTHTHLPLVEAMMQLDLDRIDSRSDADKALAGAVNEPMIRQFLLQSLESGDGGYRWRLNLPALKAGMDDLVGFPDNGEATFDGPALFLHGADSDYVLPEHHPRIERYFPNAEYAAIDNAGHWVHAEQPAALVKQVRSFLGDNGHG